MNEELKVIISAEIANLKRNLEDAKKQVSSFKDKTKEAAADVDKNFQRIGEVSVNALKGIGVAVTAAGAALIGVSAATEEYRENQAKLATAFESAGASAS